MLDWWLENGPPVYVAAAAYLGLIKDKKTSSSKPEEGGGDLYELLKFAGPDGMLN